MKVAKSSAQNPDLAPDAPDAPDVPDAPDAQEAQEAPSPFLPSSCNDLPLLRRINIPTGALAEFKQQMTLQVVDLPIPTIRCPQRVRAYKPSVHCPPSFVYAFNGFCSARRTVSTCCMTEAELMLSSEALELIANSKKDVGKHGSVSPRSLCISLVIPRESMTRANVIPFIDGIAALSDAKLKDGVVPITTKIRYSIYGGPASIPASQVLAREAFDKKDMDGVTLMVRWAEKSADKYRSECMSLGSTCPLPGEACRSIQMATVKLSVAFGFDLPSDFFLDPPSSDVAYYEKQIRECSEEFRNVLHRDDAFVPSEAMRMSGSGILRCVPGCYARLTPIEKGLKGVVSEDAIHAILLCADGKECKALQYAKTYREGLRPPDGEDEELDLHTAAVHTERVYLNGMVSLYANGGKSGELLHTDGNWLYKTTAAVVPIRTLMKTFYVFSCNMQSLIPENKALLKYMDIHINKSIQLYTRVFAVDDLDRMMSNNPVNTMQVSEAELNRMPDEQRFVLSALGVDLKSNRMFIGDAISFLTQHGAPKSLIDLLTKASLRVGLRTTLSEGFASCVAAMDNDTQNRDFHSKEVERLKRVADAALVMGCRKRSCNVIPDTKPEKVRQLMKMFALKSGTYVAKLDNFVHTPRNTDDAQSLARAVYQSYTRMSSADMPHIKELEKVMQTYSDMYAAMCKCFRLCMVKPGFAKPAFVIIHGHEMSQVSVNEVTKDGRLAHCGIGKVFEAEKPCIVIVKLRSDTSCIVTPLVTH